ncbi:MAG: HD-GYP domain-containing protein [Pseudomonadota bacterium]
MSEQEESALIDVARLRVGLYISLDLSWMDHPFISNSFKISDEGQIQTIKRLGLKQVRYYPAKSSALPLEPVAQATPTVDAAPQTSPEELAAIQAKQQRIERLRQHRQSVLKCEKLLLESVNAIKQINQTLFSQPRECVANAISLISKMVDSLLTDKDVAIYAMNDKVAGEDVYHHPLNVSILAMILAKQLGLSKDEVRLVGLGALFHDIGKTKIPDNILRKTQPLTKPEQNFLAQHPIYGEEIGRNLGLAPPVIDIIRYHHEAMDGSGYPARLAGEAIPYFTRLVCVVNTFDNLCNPVNPLNALTPYEAISSMFAKQRHLFDAAILKSFIHTMGVYPPGTVVRLSNEMWAIVTSVNTNKPLKPTVVAYDADVPKEEARLIDLEHEPTLSISKTVRPAQLPQEVFNYLSPRRRITYYFDEASPSSAVATS